MAARYPGDPRIIVVGAVVRASDALRLRDMAVADVSLRQTIIEGSKLSPRVEFGHRTIDAAARSIREIVCMVSRVDYCTSPE